MPFELLASDRDRAALILTVAKERQRICTGQIDRVDVPRRARRHNEDVREERGFRANRTIETVGEDRTRPTRCGAAARDNGVHVGIGVRIKDVTGVVHVAATIVDAVDRTAHARWFTGGAEDISRRQFRRRDLAVRDRDACVVPRVDVERPRAARADPRHEHFVAAQADTRHEAAVRSCRISEIRLRWREVCRVVKEAIHRLCKVNVVASFAVVEAIDDERVLLPRQADNANEFNTLICVAETATECRRSRRPKAFIPSRSAEHQRAIKRVEAIGERATRVVRANALDEPVAVGIHLLHRAAHGRSFALLKIEEVEEARFDRNREEARIRRLIRLDVRGNRVVEHGWREVHDRRAWATERRRRNARAIGEQRIRTVVRRKEREVLAEEAEPEIAEIDRRVVWVRDLHRDQRRLVARRVHELLAVLLPALRNDFARWIWARPRRIALVELAAHVRNTKEDLHDEGLLLNAGVETVVVERVADGV